MKRLNLNRFLKLRIRGKLVIAFAGLSILPMVVVGMLGISWNVQSLRLIAFENLNHDLIVTKERVDSFFESIEDQIDFQISTASFETFLEESRQSDGESEVIPENVGRELIGIAGKREIFYQIKFINPDGDEVFGIRHVDGRYLVLAPEDLNRVGTHFYLYMSQRIPPNTATFVPSELRGDGQRGLTPAISCIYPVHKSGFVGVFVCQIYADRLFSTIEALIPRLQAGTLALVSEEGYYLYHSTKKKDWNRLLASKDFLNLATDFGEEQANRLLSATGNETIEFPDKIVARASVFGGHAVLGNSYTILKSVSKDEIFEPVGNFMGIFFGLIGFFLVLSFVLAYLATQQFSQPIKTLRKEAEVIARGNYAARVHVRTYDEIESLADQFNLMAESLQQRESALVKHQQHLEQMVAERTHAVVEGKNRLQVILDNVPSGFALIDRELRILTASAAMAAITGVPTETLTGMLYPEILPDGDLSTSSCMKAFESGVMQTQLRSTRDANAREHFLEHVSVPLKKEDKVHTVLEIMTDITERKRLQDQLIRSEKLATTGVIAAAIAHQMRNSLTSIRMILQLFGRGNKLVKSEQGSLAVALDSISSMEAVVNDLLQLARPARFELKHEDLNRIVRDSVDFASHQLSSESVNLQSELEPGTIWLTADRQHLKDAIANLVLNAAQSLVGRGDVLVSTAKKKLDRELRDLGEVERKGPDVSKVSVEEVVLEKNTEVAVVTVRDTGAGIPKENLSRVFDPFFTTKPSGTGLGLSFVKRVVNQHGGVIEVESEIGRGSAFLIHLPTSFGPQEEK